jgi:hypothetical protein
MISVEMPLRCATDTPCLDWENFPRILFNPETRPTHHLESERISGGIQNALQNQDLTSRAA